ncbi:hypothetical protein M378DRAFT_21350 [Amanita muscaria Koide BX008]|uniref:Uncharacterized protein n=1 Tax=Amanita muscaria (strain Koide BX008) TaxID=946122 RepID=A0A0C2X4C0_AMAMK|nr:hypothetical protein M378DRAFT_21350 [Amanita muscaria Koide BX008]
MAVPEISVLVTYAKDIVSSAGEKGELSALTHRIVRKEIEKQLSLAQGTLDISKYRKPLKSAITTAVEEARGKKQTARVASVISFSSDEERTIKKKPPMKQRKGGQASTSKEDDPKKHKSAEFVASDADSEDEDSKTSSKSTTTHVLVLSDEESEGDGGHVSSKLAVAGSKRVKPDSRRTDETRTSSKAISTGDKRVLSPEDGGENFDINAEPPKSRKADEKSDTELSDLIDEPPKKKKASSKPHVKPVSRDKTRATKKKSTEPVNKDEETIKRLKSLVTACGVRKVWSRIFEGMDKPSQKIRKLKEILSDLGMKSRLSMEQAKAIRAKRELAQELEDVQTFERSVARKGENKRSTTKDDSEDEDEDEEPKPKRRKENARQSIMAFLQDQSESE